MATADMNNYRTEKVLNGHLQNENFVHKFSCANSYDLNGGEPQNSILHFYNGTSLFVTGVTGFVGKALLEKILRTCTGVEKVYVLVRPKKGQDGKERLMKILTSPAFDNLKEINPGALLKVKLVHGDVAHDNMGMSEEDRQMLINNVNIVLHSAASVRFNEPLKDAITLNTCGTKNVLDLCKQIKNLKSFVHVSTAFSNPDKNNHEIKEIVYRPRFDPFSLINCIQTLPPEILKSVESQLIEGHPNTYTFSKSLAEALVEEYSNEIPAAIVRPSIVTAAWKEPIPGWTDSISGATGIVIEVGRGTIRSILCKGANKTQIIPVDVVVDTVLTAAWHIHYRRSNSLRVYNCTSGNINPITWKEFSDYVEHYAKQFPSKYVTWYPGYRHTENKYTHWFIQIFLQYLLAFVLDISNKYFSKKYTGIRMMNLHKKSAAYLDVTSFFTLNEFNFAQENIMWLVEDVKMAPDGNNFNVDIKKENGFSWASYMRDYTLGIRKCLLKDDISSLPKAKNTLNRLYWIDKAFTFSIAYIVIRTMLWLIGTKLWYLFRCLNILPWTSLE